MNPGEGVFIGVLDMDDCTAIEPHPEGLAALRLRSKVWDAVHESMGAMAPTATVHTGFMQWHYVFRGDE